MKAGEAPDGGGPAVMQAPAASPPTNSRPSLHIALNNTATGAGNTGAGTNSGGANNGTGSGSSGIRSGSGSARHFGPHLHNPADRYRIAPQTPPSTRRPPVQANTAGKSQTEANTADNVQTEHSHNSGGSACGEEKPLVAQHDAKGSSTSREQPFIQKPDDILTSTATWAHKLDFWSLLRQSDGSSETEKQFRSKRMSQRSAEASALRWAALAACILLALLAEQAAEDWAKLRSEANLVALRSLSIVVALAAAGLDLACMFFGHASGDKGALPQLLKAYQQNDLALSTAAILEATLLSLHQFWCRTREENYLSLLTFVLFLALIPASNDACPPRFVSNVSTTVLSTVFFVIGAIVTAAIDDSSLPGAHTALTILVPIFLAVAVVRATLDSEVAARKVLLSIASPASTMVAADRAKQPASEKWRIKYNELKAEYEKLRAERLGQEASVAVPTTILVDKALRVARRLMDNPNLSTEEYVGLSDIFAALGSHPDLYPSEWAAEDPWATDDKVDLETRAWLTELFATNTMVKRTITNSQTDHVIHRRATLSQGLSTSNSVASDFIPVTKNQENRLRLLLADIDVWDFDLFLLNDLTNGRPIFAVGFTLFERYGLLTKFNIDRQVLMHFLDALEAGYFQNPYHNSAHGADVAQTTHALLAGGDENSFSGRITDTDLLAVIIAALVHDLGHPGLSNAFLIANKDPLAVLYNDVSVLEMHHVASAFAVLNQPQCNILANLSPSEYKEVRKEIVNIVLATDLAKHFEILGQFKTHAAAGFDYSRPEHREWVLKTIVKAADISHTAKKWELHREWTVRVTEEFFKQGDVERERHQPVSAFMDREAENVPQSQIGFIDFLVAPLYDSLATVITFDEIKGNIIPQLQSNRAQWKARKAGEFGELCRQSEEEKKLRYRPTRKEHRKSSVTQPDNIIAGLDQLQQRKNDNDNGNSASGKAASDLPNVPSGTPDQSAQPRNTTSAIVSPNT